MLEVFIQRVFPKSVVCLHHEDMHVDVFLLQSSCVIFPPRSESMCRRLLATRGQSLAQQFFFLCITRNISNGLVFVPRVHRFPEHMVSMFMSGVDDNSLHSAKRRL